MVEAGVISAEKRVDEKKSQHLPLHWLAKHQTLDFLVVMMTKIMDMNAMEMCRMKTTLMTRGTRKTATISLESIQSSVC